MLLEVEMLIDGVVRTLTDRVLPDVGTRYARGQLYAAVDVLRNLRDRVEEKQALLLAEIASAEAALSAAAAALRAAGGGEPAAHVAGALGAAPASPLPARAEALRAALVVALAATPANVPDARRAVEVHLTSQAMRDVAVLKPSLLNEISKG